MGINLPHAEWWRWYFFLNKFYTVQYLFLKIKATYKSLWDELRYSVFWFPLWLVSLSVRAIHRSKKILVIVTEKKMYIRFSLNVLCLLGGLHDKEATCNAGDLSLIPGLGRSPGEGHGNPLQYLCLENPYEQRSLEGYSL